MSQLYGVGLNIECNRLINDFRMKLQKKQGLPLRAIGLCFWSKGARLSQADFEKCLAEFNIFPTKVQLQTLMKGFGQDGCLCVESFMCALRPELCGRRKAIVDAAWAAIDENCEGKVSLERLSEVYDVSRNSDFIEGKMTKEQLFEAFCDGLCHNGQPVDCVRRDVEWKFYQ